MPLSLPYPRSIGRYPMPWGRRLLWSDATPRATFVVPSVPAVGGAPLVAGTGAGGLALLYSWEQSILFALQAPVAISSLQDARVVGYPTGGNVPSGFLVTAACRGTALQITLGAPGAQASPGSWYTVQLAALTVQGNRLEIVTAPIGCPA